MDGTTARPVRAAIVGEIRIECRKQTKQAIQRIDRWRNDEVRRNQRRTPLQPPSFQIPPLFSLRCAGRTVEDILRSKTAYNAQLPLYTIHGFTQLHKTSHLGPHRGSFKEQPTAGSPPWSLATESRLARPMAPPTRLLILAPNYSTAGGVVSGLGKGVTASSIGVLLKSQGFRTTSIKIDPYLNCDAGTMSPFEHGERPPLGATRPDAAPLPPPPPLRTPHGLAA